MIQIEEGWRVWVGVSVEGWASRGCQWFDINMTPNNFLNECSYAAQPEIYRSADNSLARSTSRCILFDGENISFDASIVIYEYM